MLELKINQPASEPIETLSFAWKQKGYRGLWSKFRPLLHEMHRTRGVIETWIEQWFSDCVVGAGNLTWVHRSCNKYLEISICKIGELE